MGGRGTLQLEQIQRFYDNTMQEQLQQMLTIVLLELKHSQMINPLSLNIHVVVNFLSQVIFVFLLFLGMIMYANEVETKEK